MISSLGKNIPLRFQEKELKRRQFDETENMAEKRKVKSVLSVEFCKGPRQSGLVSVWQHTLVGQQWERLL